MQLKRLPDGSLRSDAYLTMKNREDAVTIIEKSQHVLNGQRLTVKFLKCERSSNAVAISNADPNNRPQVLNDKCKICFDNYESSTDHWSASLRCGHIFGNSCVRIWLDREGTCPTCRQSTTSNQLSRVFFSMVYITTIPSYDSSPYTTPSPNEQTENRLECLVCGDLVVHRHFGKATCNSCSAFYRRSVAKRQAYFCKMKSECCDVRNNRYKTRCSYCRLEKCITVGMDMHRVMDNVPAFLAEGNGTLLSTLKLWLRSCFITRKRIHIDIYGLENFQQMWEKCRTGESFIKATRVEAYTMNEFYRACGLIEYEQHHTDFEKLFCTELLFIWMLIEIVFTTRAHGGFRSKKVYLFDNSYLAVNEDALYEFYRSHKHVKSPSSLSRTSLELMASILSTTELIHRYTIDDHERVVIMFICLFNKITRAFGPQPKLQMWKSQLFTDLSAYYTQTYSNTAIRFGQLMDCISAIENTHVHQIHQLSIVRLDYKSNEHYGYNIYSAQVFD